MHAAVAFGGEERRGDKFVRRVEAGGREGGREGSREGSREEEGG